MYKYAGNGKILDDNGVAWFILDLLHIPLEEEAWSQVADIEGGGALLFTRTCYKLKIFRPIREIDPLSETVDKFTTEVAAKLIDFERIEYYPSDHELPGQIRSIIF